MTKLITDVFIAVNYPKYQHYHYHYECLPEHTYKLLSGTLIASMYDGSIVNYLIVNKEVLSNDEKRH